jgi:hypothetical protein
MAAGECAGLTPERVCRCSAAADWPGPLPSGVDSVKRIVDHCRTQTVPEDVRDCRRACRPLVDGRAARRWPAAPAPAGPRERDGPDTVSAASPLGLSAAPAETRAHSGAWLRCAVLRRHRGRLGYYITPGRLSGTRSTRLAVCRAAAARSPRPSKLLELHTAQRGQLAQLQP